MTFTHAQKELFNNLIMFVCWKEKLLQQNFLIMILGNLIMEFVLLSNP